MQYSNHKSAKNIKYSVLKVLCAIFFGTAAIGIFLVLFFVLNNTKSEAKVAQKAEDAVQVDEKSEIDISNIKSYTSGQIVTVSHSFVWRPALYTAVLVADKLENGAYDVSCNVHTDENTFHTTNLGKSISLPQIVRRWGKLTWTADSLIIGKDKKWRKQVSRSDIESL